MKTAQQLGKDESVRRQVELEAAVPAAEDARAANATAMKLAETAGGARLEAQCKLLEAGFETQLKVARLDAAAAGAAETTKNAVEAAAAKAKNEMFLMFLAAKAEDAAKAATLQQGHMNALESTVARVRADQARRDTSGDNLERQWAFIELTKLNKSSAQPFCAAETASGFMQMAVAPEATARTAGPNNEPQPIVPTTPTCASLEPLRLDAAPGPLAIMDAPPLLPFADELLELSKKIVTLKVMLSQATERLGDECENIDESDAEDDPSVARHRSLISDFEKHIKGGGGEVWHLRNHERHLGRRGELTTAS